MKRAILILIVTSFLASCGIFKNTSRTKVKDKTKTETTVSTKQDISSKTLDKSKQVTREIISGVANSPEKKVVYKGVPEKGETATVIDSAKVIELKMWWDEAGSLVTQATKLPESILVQNAGIRETIVDRDIETTTSERKSVKSTENTSETISEKETIKKGQSLLKLLPFFLLGLAFVLVVIFFRKRR